MKMTAVDRITVIGGKSSYPPRNLLMVLFNISRSLMWMKKNNGSIYPKEAFEFIKFVCGKEGETILAKGGSLIPALKEVTEKSFTPPPENIKVYINQVENVAFSPGRFPWYEE